MCFSELNKKINSNAEIFLTSIVFFRNQNKYTETHTEARELNSLNTALKEVTLGKWRS